MKSHSFDNCLHTCWKSRDVSLPGAEPYPSVASLPRRFLDHNYTESKALTLKQIRKSYIEPQELERYYSYLQGTALNQSILLTRISRLEMLDEVEELELVLEHYAITWGVKLSGENIRSGSRWTQWGININPIAIALKEEYWAYFEMRWVPCEPVCVWSFKSFKWLWSDSNIKPN